MARPRSNLDDFLDWQARLESYKASGLDVLVVVEHRVYRRPSEGFQVFLSGLGVADPENEQLRLH